MKKQYFHTSDIKKVISKFDFEYVLKIENSMPSNILMKILNHNKKNSLETLKKTAEKQLQSVIANFTDGAKHSFSSGGGFVAYAKKTKSGAKLSLVHTVSSAEDCISHCKEILPQGCDGYSVIGPASYEKESL